MDKGFEKEGLPMVFPIISSPDNKTQNCLGNFSLFHFNPFTITSLATFLKMKKPNI